jgi:hypothetical protein
MHKRREEGAASAAWKEGLECEERAKGSGVRRQREGEPIVSRVTTRWRADGRIFPHCHRGLQRGAELQGGLGVRWR